MLVATNSSAERKLTETEDLCVDLLFACDEDSAEMLLRVS